MSKNRKLWIILDLIFVVVFNVLFFMISGFDHKTSVWAAYVFIHVAYVLLIVTPKFIEGENTSNAIDVPIYTISVFFFLAEFVINIFLIVIKIGSVKPVFIVNLIVIAIYAYLIISNMIANNKTSTDIKRQSLEAYFIKSASENLRIIKGRSNDQVKDIIERLCDKISASQTKSNSEVADLERDIIDMIGQLGDAVDCDDIEKIEQLTKGITRKVDDRNSRLRILG